MNTETLTPAPNYWGTAEHCELHLKLNGALFDREKENRDWTEWINEQLEFKIVGEFDTAKGKWHATGAEILVTDEGPTVWLAWKGDEDFHLFSYGYNEKFIAPVTLPRLSETIESFVQAVTE